MNQPFAYQPCPGLPTGGRLFRNSFCWRSASFCWSASRACCSGLGAGPAQPSNAINSVEIRIDLKSSFFIREMEQDNNQSDPDSNLRPDAPQVGEAGLFHFRDVVFAYCLLAVVVLKRFQTFQDFIQRQLVFQIHLIIDLCAQAIFVRLPILRHQDNWRLQDGKNVNPGAHQQKRIWVEADFPNPKQPHVYPYPNVDDNYRGKNEFPAAAKFSDEIRCAIGKRKLRCFLDIDVAGCSVSQKFIRVPQSIGKRCKHLQRDIWVAGNKGKKMLARKHSQPRILCNSCISGARLAIEQRHFAKKIAAAQFGKRYLMSVLRLHTDADLSLLDYVHRVALVTRAKQNCACLAILALEQFAQLVGRLSIERLKQWHVALCLDVHLLESDGTW